MQLTMLGLFYLLALLLSAVLPVVGQFLPWLLTPVLSVGLIGAARMVDQGRELPMGGLLAVLTHGFRERQGTAWKPLLILGMVNICSVVFALLIASLADGGVLFDFISGRIDAKDPALAGSKAQISSMLFLAVYVPCQMALWYAPALTAWEGLAPAKSLFFSFVSVIRNKWAFLIYFSGWLVVLLIVAVLLRILGATMGGSSMLLLVMASPLLYTALYVSFWPSYRDVFGADPQALPAAR